MSISTIPHSDQDAARARYVAPGVLELRLAGRLTLGALRRALRALEALCTMNPGARRLLLDACELTAYDRAVPAALSQWFGAHGTRFTFVVFIAKDQLVRVMLRFVAAAVPSLPTELTVSRDGAWAAFDDALLTRR